MKWKTITPTMQKKSLGTNISRKDAPKSTNGSTKLGLLEYQQLFISAFGRIRVMVLLISINEVMKLPHIITVTMFGHLQASTNS